MRAECLDTGPNEVTYIAEAGGVDGVMLRHSREHAESCATEIPQSVRGVEVTLNQRQRRARSHLESSNSCRG